MNLAMQGLLILGPWLLGLAVQAALAGRPRSALEWLAASGGGYVIGALLWGFLLRWAPVDLAAWPAWSWLPAGLGLAGLAAAWRRPGWARAAVPGFRSRRDRVLATLIIAALLALGLALAVQALNLPTLAWDAWSVWMARPRAWAGAGQLLPFADLAPWLQSPPGTRLFSHAAGYPDTLPRYALWIGLLDGQWASSRAALAWPLLWLALGLGGYGHLRAFGLRGLHALAAVGILLSLPLLCTHVVLFGYADLWVAAGFLLGLLHAARALRWRRRGDALLAALFLLLLPTVKFEGGVWLLCALGGALLALLRAWAWRRWAFAAAALALLWSTWRPLPFPLPGLGWASWEWGAVTLPQLGRIVLSWRPVLQPVFESLFLLPNWGLLWPAVCAVLVMRWRRPPALPALAHLEGSLLLGAAFLFLLFFFTDAARWAENMTSLNRVLLQAVPAVVIWAALVLAPRPAVRGRYS